MEMEEKETVKFSIKTSSLDDCFHLHSSYKMNLLVLL